MRTVGLTPREREVARMLAEGIWPEEASRILGRAAHTIKQHTMKIAQKLNIDTKRKSASLVIAVYWNCELFQIGLRELGILPENEAEEVAA